MLEVVVLNGGRPLADFLLNLTRARLAAAMSSPRTAHVIAYSGIVDYRNYVLRWNFIAILDSISYLGLTESGDLSTSHGTVSHTGK